MSYTGYSSTLYSRWSRSQFDMSLFDIPYSHIERIAADSITYEQFTEKYNRYQIPVIVTGALKHWKSTSWTVNTFLEKYGQVEFKTDQQMSHLAPHYSELYIEYLKDKAEGKDLSKYDDHRRE